MVDRSTERRAAFLEALPAEVRDAEDSIDSVVASMNASPRSKLQRMLRVADMISAYREPFVACQKGCSSCCHMNVQINSVEAERLAAASGRTAVRIKSNMAHSVDRYAGVPCPFLDKLGSCSVYADRPLPCRTHASFAESADLCDPSVMNNVTVPQIQYEGLEKAVIKLVQSKSDIRVGDIRDFFPPGA